MIIVGNPRLELRGNLLFDLTNSSPDPGSDFEQRLTLAMKRFTLDEYILFHLIISNCSDPEDSLTKKMHTVKIKENENKVPQRSPFHFQFGSG